MKSKMQKDFVPYEPALELKELGFDEPCFGFYESTYGKDKVIIDNSGLITNSNFSKVFNETRFRLVTPTYSQAFRWFREKYDLKISFPYWNGFNKMIPEDLGRDKYEIMIIPNNHRTISVRNLKGRIWFDTYEEAELACLRKLIQIVKEKQ
jgi:hypothetical protein